MTLHIILFLINSTVAPAIIIIVTLDFRFLHSGTLVVPVGGCVHRALLLALVQEIRLVRDGALVSLASVVQDGVGDILQQRRSHQLRTLLA